MREWENFSVGDVVTRDGTDEHLIYGVDMNIDVICIKAPSLPWTKYGETESNSPWRYTLVRKASYTTP